MAANEQPPREKEIFEQALDIATPEERAGFLKGACGNNAPLRERVEALLRASQEAEDFLPGSPQHRATLKLDLPGAVDEALGTRISHYKLLQKVGEGGCGVVYMAEQEEPVRRRVALKVIKLGMDTKSVVARFEAERQALAMMDHPNIAKVLDAGTTDKGRPYFVMELMRGIRITDYCDQNQLPTEARLELFITVCQAVQHAHQKGIIHRDIKPSNILVTLHDGVPVPKVIDFGIAKAIEQKLTDKTLFTELNQFMGTPAYMSPEQAEMSGLDIDTRSDIYSLGVLLYELLTGRTPFEVRELVKEGLDAIRRTIREVEPPRPSTRVSTLAHADLDTVAKARGTGSLQLRSQLRGDLDWIVMKALEKDRTRRYETANGFAADLTRHLTNEVVVARPPSNVYKFQKLVRRNKLAFAAAAAVVTALLVGLGGSVWQSVEKTRAYRRAVAAETAAKMEAKKSQQVAQFLKEMLNGVGPSVASGRDTKMLQEILDKTADRLSTDLKDQPEVEADLRSTIGNVYFELAKYEKAEAMQRNSLEMRRKLFGEEHWTVATSLNDLGLVFWKQGKLAEAEDLIRQALTMRRKLLGGEHRDVIGSLDNLGAVLSSRGKLAEAEQCAREALKARQKRFGDEHIEVAKSLNNLGFGLWSKGKLAEAETTFREALAMVKKLRGETHADISAPLSGLASVLSDEGKLPEAEIMYREELALSVRVFGEDHPNVADSFNDLANALARQDKLPEAEVLMRKALATRHRLFGLKHPHVATSLNNLGSLLQAQGKSVEAEAMHREALAMQRALLGNEHAAVAASLHNLAVALQSQARWVEAEATYREALDLRRKLLGYENPDVAITLNNLANVLQSQGKLAEAGLTHREVLAITRKLFGNEHPATAMSLANLAIVLRREGKPDEAEALHREALAIRRKFWKNEHSDVANSMQNLGFLLQRRGQLAEAEGLLLDAVAMYTKLFGSEHPRVANAIDCLGDLRMSQGQLAEAERNHQESLAIRRKMLGNQHPDVADSLNGLGDTFRQESKWVEAEDAYREAAIILEKANPNDWQLIKTRTLLGVSLLPQRKYTDAEPLLLTGYEGLNQRQAMNPADIHPILREAAQNLVTLFEATQRPDQAAEWKNKLGQLREPDSATRSAPETKRK